MTTIAPSDGAGKTPGAAEDHHRVDRDQDLRVVVVGEGALEEAPLIVPASAATPAPTPTARTLSLLIGMLITWAASESSLQRAPCAARTRWFAKRQRREDDHDRDSVDVEVARSLGQLVAEGPERSTLAIPFGPPVRSQFALETEILVQAENETR